MEQRRLLAFDFVAAYAESPIPFFVAGDTTATPQLSEAPQQLTLRFSPGVRIDAASIGGSIGFVRSVNGVLGDANDLSVMPVAPFGSVTVGDLPNQNEVVIRFAETLPDDLYRFTISSGLKAIGGDSATSFQFDVRLDLGAFVTAVVPQPVERLASGSLVQHRDRVEVHFNAGDPLNQASAQTAAFYRLVPVSASGVDGSPVVPAAVSYSAAAARAVLDFAPGAIADGAVYRLEIGTTLATGTPTAFAFSGAADDDNSSFVTATPLGGLAANGITVAARIDDRPSVATPAGSLAYPGHPGTLDEPGHRDMPADSGFHGLENLETRPLRPSWVLSRAIDGPIGFYNFRPDYGRDPQGNPLSNTITEAQKQRTREVFDLFGAVTGIRFVEEVRAPYAGLTVATGDIRAIDPEATPGPGGVIGIAGSSRIGTGLFSRAFPAVVMDAFEEWGSSEYGGAWFETAMHEIGHALGLPHSYDLPSIMGAGLTGEKVYPGDYDTIHLRQLFPTNGTDIDVYAFTVAEPGSISAETFAGRPGSPVTSFLDTVVSLYREDVVGTATVRTLVARNDDSVGRDSFVGLEVKPGRYFVVVTSTGNEQFNPEAADTGSGGRTRGPYELRPGFTPAPSATATIVDARRTPLDGDRDGLPGGTHAFWFTTASAAETVFVDKLGPATGADGTLTKPYRTISAALSAVTAANTAAPGSRKIVRIVGNDAQTPYLLGTTTTNQSLADGTTFNVPKGVTVMIDAGAVFKLRSAVIDVGSSQPLPSTSRAGAALQVLGVPSKPVTFTSYHDDSIGGDSDGAGPGVQGGQWGGIVLRKDSDVSAGGSTGRAWLNSISNATLRYGGGQVRVDSQLQAFAPIQIEGTRPTVAFNTITESAGAAIAATPNSFEDSRGRVGPEIRGNRLLANSVNGLFVKIFTRFGSPLEQLDVAARFRSTDVVYVLQENLLIAGGAGGSRLDVSAGGISPRPTGRLTIDPGVIVKLQNSRIELERGAARLMAEGTESNPVILTSLGDNRYGAGGTFDTNGNIPDVRAAGDWGGIILNAGARASIDRAYVAFGGGLTPIEGTSDFFNVIEVHQGDLRLTNSRIENNLAGLAGSDRTGRGTNAAATIFVRGAQPTVGGNDFRANAGAVISVNANSLSDVSRPDGGRSTGPIDRFDRHDDNVGPLVAGNVLAYTSGTAALAGMKIRGEEITVESVWDDTDIVHVLEEEIVVRNFHTATGLRLQSRPNASLVVKLRGATAGLTAEGYGLDIDDRIGGTVQIVGQPGRPVVLTSLADDTVGASVDPLGRTVTDTGNDGAGAPAAGDWRSLLFLPLSNDRNVSISVEAERPLTSSVETNAGVDAAEDLGTLAPNFPTGANSWESAQEKSGDENRRLGFEVHGFIAADDPTDVDVYSFQGYAGSEIWIDVDKTSAGLDAMVELLDSFGNVLARSADEAVESRLANEAVADGVGGSSVTYTLAATGIVQGTFVGTLRDGVTGLAIQDFAIAADGSATFYDRLPASPFHATAATLDPSNGLLTLAFDRASGPTVVEVSYVHATGALSAETLGLGQSAQRDGWRGGDFYTTNPRDPGMRVVLPGSPGQQLRYFVRVRSQPRQDAATLARFPGATPLERYESSLQSGSFDQPGDPAAGATSGRYELRVRLRQRDEKPGSVVRHADIRFPNTGIDVRGLPRNALLAGETGETNQANGAFTESQYVGNLLESDRNTISIAGALSSSTDVDWYRFALNFEQIQGTSPPPTWATVFDIDHADGFRGDLTLAVFDATGRLLYVGRDSDVQDDQPGAGQGNDLDDLSRGSLGKLDPFLGTVQLPTDNPKGSRDVPANPAEQLTYFVAVMSNGQLPSQLDATFQSAAGNVLVRLEPVTSIKRVAEDHIGFTGYTSEGAQVDQTTLDPVSGSPRPLIDISSTTSLSANVRPFTIADVTLFVSTSSGIFTVDAMTGVRETTLITGITNITLGDLDMRTDGKLYAYAGVNNNATTAGRLIEVDAGNGTFVSEANDGIESPGDPHLNYQTGSNTVTALAFRRTGVADYDELWFIVRDFDRDGAVSKLYRAADGGSATTAADPTADQSFDDSETLGYRGFIKGTVTGLQFANDADRPAPASPLAPVPNIYGVTADGRFIAILAGEKIADDGIPKDDEGNVIDGPPTEFEAQVTLLGDFTPQLEAAGLTGFQGLAAAPRNLDGGRFAGMFVAVAVGRVASGLGPPTFSARLCIIDPATNELVRLTEWGPGTAAEPGELFSPELEVGSLTEITGLAFSPLDVNLWHPTERRGDTARDTVAGVDRGHGIARAPDNTRDLTSTSTNRTVGQTLDSRTHTEAQGGVSMYFGLEQYQSGTVPSYLRTGGGNAQYGADPTWQEDLTANPAIRNNYNLPGGAYGSLITNPFSLAGYVYTDKPTLYFNYWLDTEGEGSKTSFMRDSARVLISVDQGVTWELLATNNSTRSASGTADAELPTVISASSAVGSFANQHVQELFEAPAVTDPIDPLRNHWRQARVDLGKWAGNTDIRLRFDFHTAGEFDPDQVDAAGNLINTISGRANETGNFNNIERGQKNEFEGFYVDDIVVGFAERGEMVTEAQSAETDPTAADFIEVDTPPGGPAQALQGPYQLEIRHGTDYSLPTGVAAETNDSSRMRVFRTFDTNERLLTSVYSATGELRGDSNLPREQGQFVIDGNIITSAANYGISIDAGVRDAVSTTPHPGVARNLPTLNNAQLVPGAFVVNNVVSSSGLGGIRFSGDSDSDPVAVVPFGRIVNNTIYGGTTARGIGIQVTDRAGPTLMNNLFANLTTGVSVDGSSQRDAAGKERTVVTHSGFSNVATPISGVTDRFRVTLSASPFVNAAAGNFYPAAGTAAIDTSLNSLQDRNEFLVVNSAIGVPPAPILAPEKDLYGQVRWDDPAQTPSVPGLGVNAFKDLGAVDRIDFSQSPPYLVMLDPRDNGGSDNDSTIDVIEMQYAAARNRRVFSFQIIDPGAGIDPNTVVAAAFTITRDGLPLISGKDYVFQFVDSNNRVVLEAASIFRPGIYTIVASNTIQDLAGNPIRPNNLTSGTTEFEVRLLDVPYAPAWPSPLTPIAPALPGWHEDHTIHLGWLPAFTVLPSLPILDYDVEMSTDIFLTPGIPLTPNTSTVLTTLTATGLTNGAKYWFRVRATNALGTGPWSDMLGPIVPQPAPTIAIAADTGSSTTDGITQTGMVLVAGVAVGAKWQYRYAGGSWTDGSGSSFVLPDGSYPVGDVQVRQIVAGFSSVPATNPRQWIIDSKTPDAPIITSVVDDALLVVGPLGNGAVTNDAMPTFIGKAEAGATLRITVNSSPWAAITIPSDGIWSYTFTVLTDGPYTFTFVAVDSAGNESLPATFGLTIDTVAPFVTITSVADDVINSIGNLVSGASTNDTTPTFTGTSEAGVKLRIVVNGGTPSFITVPAGGIWTYTPTPLLDGAYTFSFTAVDAAGNDSPAVFFALTVDTVAPPAPVITSVVDDVAPATGSIANGATTNDSTPTFTGTATPGMTLRVIVDNGVPAFSTVPANGIWTFVPQSLGEGNHTFSFTAIDAAANRSLITSLSLVVDTIAPTTPVITAVTDNVAPVSGSLVSGGFTNDPTPTFTGTADAGTTLRITTNGGTPTTITVPAGGAWTYTPTLANGAYAFSFVAVDAAGNESGAAAFSLTVDTIAPQVTGVLALSPSGTYGIGQSVDIQVTFSEPVTVTGAPSLQLNTTPLRSAVYVSGSGTDVFLFRYAIQTGDVSTRLDYTSTVAFGGGSFPDAAGNPASLTLPPVGTFLGKNIAIDALIKATVVGLGQWPSDPPDFASAVAAFQVQFNTPVTGFAVGSISLQRLDNPADPASGRAVSLTGVSVSGSGTNWTITLPSATNPTSLKGRYKLVIGGVNSGIQSGGVTMNIPGEWYFDRI